MNDVVIPISFSDTAGQKDLARLRSVCYEIDSVASLENITHYWMPEIRNHVSPDTKVVLVGTKLDLRHQLGYECLSTEDGLAVAKAIGAEGVYECSSLSQENLANVFEGAIRVSVSPSLTRKHKHKPSSISRRKRSLSHP